MGTKSSKTDIFVSYSHDDVKLITPIVQLLRLKPGFVFFDIDSIQPGIKWRDEIKDSLNRAKIIIVVWCEHSSESVEVQNEYSLAIKNGKNILPLLLDNTPLPSDLAQYQWVDLRHFFGFSHIQQQQQQEQQGQQQQQRQQPQQYGQEQYDYPMEASIVNSDGWWNFITDQAFFNLMDYRRYQLGKLSYENLKKSNEFIETEIEIANILMTELNRLHS